MIAARTMETRDGRACDVPEADLRALARRLDGRLLQPGVSSYDDNRRVWNGMVDRLPATIVRCASAIDAYEAMTFARRHDLLASIHGGGDNVAGNAVCDGGLMIDLSPMRRVVVDARTRTVRVEPGCTWRDVDTACQAHGLATTGGCRLAHRRGRLDARRWARSPDGPPRSDMRQRASARRRPRRRLQGHRVGGR